MRASSSKWGPLIYVGESDCTIRRCIEHLTRILRPQGVTQQPFFEIVRRGSRSLHVIRQLLCEWLFIPVQCAPLNTKMRKTAEREVIKCIGTLNPPLVYSILSSLSHRPYSSRGDPLPVRRRLRLLRRLRPPSLSSAAALPRCRHPDLKNIAAALAGHKFEGDRAAVLAAWRLAPSPWAYVAWRVDRFEEAWRRRRALTILRLIASKRKDLRLPVGHIQCNVLWTGSLHTKQVMRKLFLKLIRRWRDLGFFVPVMRHASLKFSWQRARTVRDLVQPGHTNECHWRCRTSCVLLQHFSWA